MTRSDSQRTTHRRIPIASAIMVLLAIAPTNAAVQSRPSIIAEATGQGPPSSKPKESDKDAGKADPPATNPAPAASAAPKTTSSDGVQATHLGVGWEGVLIRLDTGPDAGKLRIVAHDRRGPQNVRSASDPPSVDSPSRQAANLPADWGLNVWRAVSRLERGDLPAAEALFESLFQTMQSRPPTPPRSAVLGASPDVASSLESIGSGPTSAVICEGVLRCRLARGAHAGSIIAYLEWVRAARRGPASVAGVWHDQAPSGSTAAPEWIGGRLGGHSDARGTSPPLPALLDAGTGLVVELPPMFVPEPALVALAESDQWSRYIIPTGPDGTPGSTRATTGGRPTLDELASWYRAAIRFDAGLSADKPAAAGSSSSTTGDSGVGLRLMRDIVMARIGEPSERDAARTALRARYLASKAEPPAWIEAWCRCAVGRSLILESDPDVRRRGVLELLYVPAAFSNQAPYLAGLSLANAAVTLHELGDSTAAGVLVRELRARFPDHGALNWETLRAIPQP